MTDFLHRLFGEQERDLIIDIFDGEEMVEATRTHFGSSGRTDIRPGFESVHRLRMMGQTWTVRVHGSTSLLQRAGQRATDRDRGNRCLAQCHAGWADVLLVSGRSRAEAAARAMTEDLSLERSRLSAILEGTRVGTWEWNVQSGETVFNEEWARIVGYKLQELEPISIVTWAKFAHPEDLQSQNSCSSSTWRGVTVLRV